MTTQRPPSAWNGIHTKLLLALIATTAGTGAVTATRDTATFEQGQAAVELLRMHDKTNADGVPVWYFPGGAVENQERMLAELRGLRKDLGNYVEQLKALQRED